jgi:hypothetical protein
LLLNDALEVFHAPSAVVDGPAAAATVVAASTGGYEIVWRPEQALRLPTGGGCAHGLVGALVWASDSRGQVPALLALRPLDGSGALEDQLVRLVARPDCDLVAVGVDRDRRHAGA